MEVKCLKVNAMQKAHKSTINVGVILTFIQLIHRHIFILCKKKQLITLSFILAVYKSTFEVQSKLSGGKSPFNVAGKMSTLS